MHVLVVEDSLIDRQLIKQLLVQHDVKVTTLSSIPEAVTFALCHQLDITLISATVHSHLDSVELLKDLKRVQSRPFVPIAMTSYVDQKRFIQLLNGGFRAVLQKPLHAHQFLSVVNSLLEEPHSKLNTVIV